MSETLYQVLFRGANGRDNLSDPEPLDDAQHTARELERKGYTVGAVMDVKSAGEYMEYYHATTYRGVRIPDDLRGADAPRVLYDAWRQGVDSMLDTGRLSPAPVPEPDATMSREVADLLLRAMAGLIEEGGARRAYSGWGPEDLDVRDSDGALIRRAADIVGRSRIRHPELLEYLARLDEEANR